MTSSTCYVCNMETSEYRQSLYELQSQHSATSIAEFIKRFLGDFHTQRNISDESNCICVECLQKIDEYDWACVMAKRFKSELRKILIKTETFFIDELKSKNDDKTFYLSNELELKDSQTINFSYFDENRIDVSASRSNESLLEELSNKSQTNEADSDEEWKNRDDSDSAFEIKSERDSDDEYIPQYRPKPSTRAPRSHQKSSINDSNSSPANECSQSKCDSLLIGHQRTVTAPSTNNAIKSGVRGRQSDQIYECKECEKMFDVQIDFVAHKRWHRQLLIPEFRCPKCFFISKDQTSFDEHDKLHENVPKLECVICHTVVGCKGTLTKHMQIHMNQPNYMCDMCGKIFLREGSLRTHKKYHLNIRTKKCPHCDMTFVESKNLNRHLRSHREERPYQCSICEKKFRYRYNVAAHEKIHAKKDINPHKCSFCSSKFPSSQKLKKHLQKNHQSVPPHLENINKLEESLLKDRLALLN